MSLPSSHAPLGMPCPSLTLGVLHVCHADVGANVHGSSALENATGLSFGKFLGVFTRSEQCLGINI